MMTQEQIIEGNKLIAEFMGWSHAPTMKHATGAPTYTKAGINATEYAIPDHFRYHRSWDWLMPVVEEIESIGQTYVEFGKKHCRIQPILYNPKKDCMEWQLLHETQCATKIEAVYSAVLKFITWYNQQPK